jgi:hypothetical protein
MAENEKPPGRPRVRYDIKIKIGKPGAKGERLKEQIRSALDQALQQIPEPVLEANDSILISTNSVNGNGK